MVRRLLAVFGALALLVPLGGVAAAQAQTTCGTVVADGLVNPRFVTLGPDGSVYVSESGSGGDEMLPADPNAPPGSPPPNRGLTGQVTKIAPDGTKSVVAANLPSYLTGDGTAGAAGIVYADGALWLAVGGPGNAPAQTPLSVEGQVVKIDPGTGAVTPVADIWSYEKAHNPDTFSVESNLYGLAMGTDSNLYVADAGGNTLYRINPSNGDLSVVAVVPGLPISADQLPPGMVPAGQQFQNPARGGAADIDPVPTGVATGPDGDISVSLLSGFPFPTGGAKVVRVTTDGTLSDAATGLTMPTGVAYGPDGMLYAAEYTTGFVMAPNQPPSFKPGNVVRMLPDGTKQVVADNLMSPNGITFDQAGNLYMVVNSSAAPGSTAGPQGQVLRCDGVAAGASAPAPAPQPAPPAPAPTPGGQPSGGEAGQPSGQRPSGQMPSGQMPTGQMPASQMPR